MNQSNQWVDTLKRCLKARGLTYQDVAKTLNLSEASIKRLFSERSFTLQRLEQICRMMDMSFSDLARVNDRKYLERQTTLSVEQELALAADATLLCYFYLFLNGWDINRIVSRFDLGEPRQIRMLVKLDKLGLIELQPGNRVRLLTARRIQWRKDGAIRRMYERDVKQAFLQHGFSEDHSHFGFESAELAPESARMILRKMSHLSQEFDELAELDVNLKPDQKRGFGLMVALRPWAYWNIIFDENGIAENGATNSGKSP